MGLNKKSMELNDWIYALNKKMVFISNEYTGAKLHKVSLVFFEDIVFNDGETADEVFSLTDMKGFRKKEIKNE